MHSVRIGQGLVAALTVSVLLLMAGLFGIGMAIQQRAIAPPELDLRTSGFRILAVVTAPAHSQARTVSGPCAPQRGACCASGQEFYLAWVLAGNEARDSVRPMSAGAHTAVGVHVTSSDDANWLGNGLARMALKLPAAPAIENTSRH